MIQSRSKEFKHAKTFKCIVIFLYRPPIEQYESRFTTTGRKSWRDAVLLG